MNSPCYLCPTRKAGCHGSCQAYKDYTEAVERIRFERQNRYYSPDDCEYRKRKRNAAERKRRRPVNALAKLRADKNIPGGVVVGTVKKLYPKFSKALLSMCEHTSMYGVELAEPAMIALIAAYAPEMAKNKAKTKRSKLPYRIYGRLSEADAREFEQAKKADGYKSTQAWILVAVRKYLAGRKTDG